MQNARETRRTARTGSFFDQAQEIRVRLENSLKSGEGDSAQYLLQETVEQLNVAMEELRVANDLLVSQNEEMARIQLELEAERKRYKDLFDFAPEAFILTDFNGTIREANRTTATLLNVEPKFMTGKPLIVFIADEERKEFRSRLSRLYQIPTRMELKFRLQPRDKAPVPAHLTVGTVYNRDRQPIGLRWLLREYAEA
jgi:PAS domain S-box-containing protein